MEYSRGMTFDSMHYRGLVARIEYDEDDHIFVGHLIGIRDIIGFHSDTLDGLQAELRVSVDFISNAKRKALRNDDPHH